MLVQVAPEAQVGDLPSENMYTYALPQMHLPGIFW